MRITYEGPLDAVELADHPIVVRRGETVDVPDELAIRLSDQGPWFLADKDVLGWVGQDRDRAARALAGERAREKPRTGLVDKLDKIANPAEPVARAEGN